MYRPFLFVSALSFLPLLACGDGDNLITPTAPQEVTGVWIGTITAGLASVDMTTRFDVLELVLTENADGQITGGAAFSQRRTIVRAASSSVTAQAFEIVGANVFPTVALTLRSDVLIATAELVYLRARFVGIDRLDGELFGGGFDQHRVALRRERTTTVLN
jgi:hypothetical protein